MRIYTLILAIFIAASVQAQSLEMTNEMTKYTALKNDLYVKKMTNTRELNSEKRDTRDILREYKALKIYASLRK